MYYYSIQHKGFFQYSSANSFFNSKNNTVHAPVPAFADRCAGGAVRCVGTMPPFFDAIDSLLSMTPPDQTPAAPHLEILAKAYAEYAELLIRHCCFRRIDRQDAEEIVQDAFVQTYEYLRRGNSVENMKVFLFKVTNNLIIDRIRQQKANQEISLDEMEEQGVEFEQGIDQAALVHRRIDAGAILSAMRELQDTDYELLRLRYIEGLTPADIAAKKGMKANSVSVRLHRLLKQVVTRMQVRKRGIVAPARV